MPQDDEFEWDLRKAQSNLRKHEVSFKQAQEAFRDPFAVEILDDSEDYGEDRYILIAMSKGRLLSIVYTPRNGRFRIISARDATRDEQDHYFEESTKS